MINDAPSPFPRVAAEVPLGAPPALVVREWAARWPWLVQGTTTFGSDSVPHDLGLFRDGSERPVVEERWVALATALGMGGVVHARQVHGGDVGVRTTGTTGLQVVSDRDGHATARPGVLLGVTAADCVPVFVVDPVHRAVAALHAGWRGAAAGVLERGLDAMRSAFGSSPGSSFVHLGPAICATCYEVGPEVFEALGEPVPPRPTPIDLRGVLARRAVTAGVPSAQLSVSSHCTRCTGSRLFSHRAGDAGRHVGFIGVRPEAEEPR